MTLGFSLWNAGRRAVRARPALHDPERIEEVTIMQRITVLGTQLLVLSLAGLACGGAQHTPQVAPVGEPVARQGEEMPGWTMRETWTDTDQGATYVYATGMDEGLDAGEESARAAASARAREALARYISVAVRSYLQRGGARDQAGSAARTVTRADGTSETTVATTRTIEETDRMLRAAEELAQQTLRGVEISFYISERRGVIYALGKVSLERLLNGFDQSPSLSDTERRRVRENRDEALAAMRQALEEQAQAAGDY